MCNNWNPCTLLVGVENVAATLEDNLDVFQRIKHRVTLCPSNATPSKRNKNKCSNKNLDINVHNSQNNSLKMETTKMSIKR